MPTSIATSNRPFLCVFSFRVVYCYSLFIVSLCCVLCCCFSLILYLLPAYISFETSYVFSLSLHVMNIMWLFL